MGVAMKQFKPYPYQEILIDAIIRHPRIALWAGMGLGKTVSTLTALKVILDYYDEGPVLVLAPKRVASTTWPDEVAKWDHLQGLRVAVAVGTAKQVDAALSSKADIYCTNYERIPDLVKRFGRNWPFKIIVADESTRLKSFRLRQGSMRARELGRVAHLYCNRFIELTGTPAPNGYEDLWGQMWFLDKGARLGKSMSAYHEQYFMPERVGSNAFAVQYKLLPFADEQIQEKLRDITVKINTEDWFPVDKPLVTNIRVKLPDEAMHTYMEMQRNLYVELANGESVESPNAAAMTNRCLQLAGGALYTEDGEYVETHDVKLQALDSIMTEAAGNPVLVSYQFKHELARIKKHFPQARVLDSNPKTVRDWNAGKIPMLLAHPASCGHGLNLQDGGNILVFYSRGWNLEEHEQIIERIGPTRQAQSGHPRPVYIYNIVAEKTLDEAVAVRLASKREVMDILLERANA
jgi:SNF2 family DNA or RNA helicase